MKIKGPKILLCGRAVIPGGWGIDPPRFLAKNVNFFVVCCKVKQLLSKTIVYFLSNQYINLFY